MNKEQFDNWCTHHLEDIKTRICQDYPKVKPHIDQDISDFYEHVLERIDSIKQYSSYFYAWVYNRNFRYHKKPQESHIDITTIEVIEEEEPQIDLDYLDSLIEQLPLDYQILYDLYYNQRMTTREIGKLYNLSHVGIHKQIKKLQLKIKEKL